MKMNFIIGATCEKALKKALSELIEKANGSEEEFIVLAPETKTLYVERYLLDNFPSHAFSNVFVYSFSRLLKKLQLKPIFPLSKEAGVMIVRNIIMEMQDNLACYKKTALTVGFAENIYETIQQLKSSGISPLELSESSQKCPVALKIKLTDIALLYDAYENYLGEDIFDPSDKLSMLEKQVELSERIKKSHVFFVGFDSLTASMTSVISSILKNAKSLTVSAPYMHKTQKNAHISDNEVFEKLKVVAEKAHIKYDPELVKADFKGDFLHIYNDLYSYPLKKQQRHGEINIFGATSEYVEARKVASLIREDILSGKYRYRDICVYLAKEELRPFVESALGDFGVPYFSACPYQFETHQVFVLVKELFWLVKRSLDQEDVLQFVRNGLLELDKDKCDDFENYVLKYSINHNRFSKPFSIDDPLKENAEEIRKVVFDVFSEFSLVCGENLRIFDLVDGIFAFFEKFELSKRLEKLYKMQTENGDERSAMATKQAEKKLSNVLLILKQFLGERKVQLDELYALLISGLESADINLLPLSIDTVQIVSSPDGLYNIKSIYIMGATDGNFPKREQDLGLIQDSEISSIENISEKKIEPTIRTINRRERYKAFELLLLPTEKLTISFSEHASSGEEEKMSALVMSLAEMFLVGEEQMKIERLHSPFKEDAEVEEFAKSLGSREVAIDYLAEALSHYRDGEDFAARPEDVHSLYKALENDMGAAKELFDNINIQKQEEPLENAKDLFFKKGTTSISELECYFSCPLKHFASYGLRLKERQLASLRALDVGDILHAVCEKFVDHYLKHKDFDSDKLAINLLMKVFKEKNYNEEENLALLGILKDESKRLLKGLKDQLDHSKFVPTLLEQWFGGGELQGIEIHENPSVKIVGRIDRVDENSDHYRIIDYKTGKLATSAEDVYYGHKLQLAIYLSALSGSKKSPAGVLYFPVHNDFVDDEEKAKDAYKMQGFLLNNEKAIFDMDTNLSLLSPKSHYISPSLKTAKKNIEKNIIEFKANDYLLSESELVSMRDYALAVAKKAINEILSGYHSKTPFKKGDRLPCDYCELKNVCGINDDEYKFIRKPSLEKAEKFYKEGEKWLTK